MTAIAERTAVDWRCRRTWLQASKNTEWRLPGCVIGGFGTITYFQFTGIAWPTLPIMILAIVNGLLTSIALETAILGRQMCLRTVFRTATGMSFITIFAVEAMKNGFAWMLTGGAKLTWWVMPITLAAGFVAPLPTNCR